MVKITSLILVVMLMMMMMMKEISSSLHSYFDSLSSKNICSMEVDRGRCGNQTRRWYYESNSKRCLLFKWSGCGGNNNNFRSKMECQQKCGHSTISHRHHHHPPLHPPPPSQHHRRRRRRHRPQQYNNNIYNHHKQHYNNNNLQHVASNNQHTCSCFRPMIYSLLLQQSQLQQQLQQLLLQQQQHLLSLQPLPPPPQPFQQNMPASFKSKLNDDLNRYNSNMKGDNDFYSDPYDYNDYKDYQYHFYDDSINDNHQNSGSIKNDDNYNNNPNDKTYHAIRNTGDNIVENHHETTTFPPINNYIQLPKSEKPNWYPPEQQNSLNSFHNDITNVQNNGVHKNHQIIDEAHHHHDSHPYFNNLLTKDTDKKSHMELKNRKAHMKLSRLPNEKYFVQESSVIKKIKSKMCQKPPYHGPCNQEVERWAYNWERKSCVVFQYGGCLGNENNFRSKQSCEDYCGNLKDSNV